MNLRTTFPLAFVALAAAVTGCGKADLYHGAARSAEFLTASAQYGPLTVREGDFHAESRIKPWSSWWYPASDDYMFKNSDSPLEKYDDYVQSTRHTDSSAAQYEHDNLYPGNSNWQGLCDAWATASLMEPEPTHPITVGGIQFGVGDLKALVVQSYADMDGKLLYGQRYNGDRDSVYDDIAPDQFHTVMQAELFGKHRPFIMDKDPGLPVWNTPVYEAFVRIKRGGRHTVHVTTWLKGASPFVPDYDYVGTLAVTFEYHYDLHGDFDDQGAFHVADGVWTGQSLDYHPDFLTVLPEKAAHHSRNPEIKTGIVNEILGRKGT